MTARALWTVQAMASAMGAERQGPVPASVIGLSIDSRSVAPGDAFFAIRGDHRDGHDFVVDALVAKAALAVVAADRRAQFPGEAPLLVVPDVLGAGKGPPFNAAVTSAKKPLLGATASDSAGVAPTQRPP